MVHPFHILDVFAERLYAGNQLAVVLDAADLSTEQMQAIAAETNFSETTFVTSTTKTDGAYPVRIFTPAEELPFAGHPTVGTAWLLRQLFEQGAAERIVLRLGIGDVPVDFEGEELGWLLSPRAELGATVPVAPILEALSLEPEDLDATFPVQLLTAGFTFVVVPLRNAASLKRCRLNHPAFEALKSKGVPPFVHALCREPQDAGNDLAARFFFDANGAREDPATGSATGSLGFYLVQHQYLGSPEFSVRIEQGVTMGRPSLLRVRASQHSGQPRIQVGGRVFAVARGELLE